MSPKQLEYFLEVYKYKSIKIAAEKLIISPQAISKMIKEIEAELDVVLFIRGKKHLEPTIEAEYLKNYAIKILEDFKNINNIKRLSNIENKALTVYSVDGFLQYVTVKFITDFKSQYPDILLNIVETTEKDIINKLKNSEINFAILSTALDSKAFDNIYLYKDNNCLIINKNHPLAKKDFIFSHDLNNQPIAGKGSNYSCYNSNISKIFNKNIYPNIVLETTNDMLIVQMAQKNLAIGICIDYIAKPFIDDEVVIKYASDIDISRNMFLVENNHSVLNKEDYLFKKFLIEWIEKHKNVAK